MLQVELTVSIYKIRNHHVQASKLPGTFWSALASLPELDSRLITFIIWTTTVNGTAFVTIAVAVKNLCLSNRTWSSACYFCRGRWRVHSWWVNRRQWEIIPVFSNSRRVNAENDRVFLPVSWSRANLENPCYTPDSTLVQKIERRYPPKMVPTVLIRYYHELGSCVARFYL